VYNKLKIGYTVVMLKLQFHGSYWKKLNLLLRTMGFSTHMYSERRLNAHVLPRSKHGNFSSIGYCQIHKNKVLGRSRQPLIVPEFDYEKQGLKIRVLLK